MTTFEVVGAKAAGRCPLCPGKKDRKVLVVRGTAYTGDICGEHLHVLALQQHPQQQPDGESTDRA